MHGPKSRGRKTEYGQQLAEKQKAKATYNIAEKQFKRYYDQAIKQRGDTSQILPQLLELRLDNVVYRLGLAKTRPQARQLVNHGFFLINNQAVNIPSYQLRLKDQITIKPQKTKAKIFTELEKSLEKHQPPSWINFNASDKIAKIISLPLVDEAEKTYNPKLVVEFYSK